MEAKILEVIRRIQNNRVYRTVTDILFPTLIVVLGMCNVNKGIDITDSAYSCSNYMAGLSLDGMWYYSTFYANILGRLFTKLPLGTTLLGLNIYTGIVKCVLALCAYYFFTKYVKVDRELVFLAEIISIALCWCPTTILYNYLTYLLFFLGTAFLIAGLKSDRKRYYLIAGFMLGSNVFVRLPNVAEAGLIVVVWFDAIINRKKASKWLSETGLCIAGYALSLIPAMIAVLFTGGIGRYVTGVFQMVSVSPAAEGYTPIGMVMAVISSYAYAWVWIEPTILFLLLVLLECLVLPSKLNWLRYVIAVPLMAFLVRMLYGKGMFSFDFSGYGPIFGFGKLIMVLFFVVAAIGCIWRHEPAINRDIAFAAIVVALITPLGSNNEVYANLNNLFWILPVFLMLLFRFVNVNEYLKGIRFSILLLVAVYAILCITFGMRFKFRDGEGGALMDTYVSNNEVLKGMKTTAENAARLEAVSDLWKENDFKNGTVLLYGNVSGMSFYLDTPLAISTAWPTLGTFAKEKYAQEMSLLAASIDANKELLPTVIIGSEELDDGTAPEKKEILNEFLERYNYCTIYSNDKFSVLTAQ